MRTRSFFTHYGYLLILVVGFLLYYNSLFINFIGDDLSQIVKPQIIHSVQNIPLFFLTSIPYIQNHDQLVFSYYKPVMFVLYAFLYVAGKGQPFIFHLLQVILHIANAVFLFYFFRKIFKKELAFFLSLLFLVHPINEETVAYIANIQDVLFFFFGMAALLLLKKAHMKWLHSLLIGVFFLLSLFSKETGALFLIVGGFYACIIKTGYTKTYIKVSTIALTIYLILRTAASSHYFISLIAVPLLHYSFLTRVLIALEIFYKYLLEIVIPTNTITPISHVSAALPSTVSNVQFGFHVLFLFFFFVATFLLGWFVWRKEKKDFKYFLFFVLWFYLGIGIHLQLVPLDALVAKRWLYFPFCGFLGMLGLFIKQIKIKNKNIRLLALSLGVAILIVYFYHTLTMNSYWNHEEILKNHVFQLD